MRYDSFPTFYPLKNNMKSTTVWLAILAAALGLFYYQQNRHFFSDDLIYPQAGQDRSAVESLNGLGYLNFLRAGAGLEALSYSSVLEQAARSHAKYLLADPDDGHDEKRRSNPFYTGFKPADRARRAGYFYNGVHENVSTGRVHPQGELESTLPVQQQTDALMTAIYHRFSLLEQNIDEAGVAFAHGKGRTAVVVNQGNRAFNHWCSQGRVYPEPGRRFYQNACFNGAVVYTDEIKTSDRLMYVAYPQGSFAAPDFYGERPDPMPGHEFTGNPASIAFAADAGEIKMLSFKLYQGKNEIGPVKILDRNTDPNRQFTDRQFALFPLTPLEYDTAYRAVFEYRQNGKKQKAEWTFRTKKPDYPYFAVKGGEHLALEAGKIYFLHWQGHWCMRGCEQITFRPRGSAEPEILERQPGGFLIRLNGKAGGSVRLMPNQENSRAVTLHIRKDG